MDLVHKIRKMKNLGDAQTYVKAAVKAQIRVVRLMRKQRVWRLTPDDMIRELNAERLGEIRSRHGVENPGIFWPKYVEFERWFEKYIQRAEDIELDYGPKRRILDIGCGAGFFLRVCQKLGHDCAGMDYRESHNEDEAALYAETTALFGLERILWRIKRFVPLPDLGPPLDLVTAFMICFDEHYSETRWKAEEWNFFLDDIQSRLRPRGKIYLEMNRGMDNEFFHTGVRELFEKRGAIIDGYRVIFGVNKSRYYAVKRVLANERRRHKPAQ